MKVKTEGKSFKRETTSKRRQRKGYSEPGPFFYFILFYFLKLFFLLFYSSSCVLLLRRFFWSKKSQLIKLHQIPLCCSCVDGRLWLRGDRKGANVSRAVSAHHQHSALSRASIDWYIVTRKQNKRKKWTRMKNCGALILCWWCWRERKERKGGSVRPSFNFRDRYQMAISSSTFIFLCVFSPFWDSSLSLLLLMIPTTPGELAFVLLYSVSPSICNRCVCCVCVVWQSDNRWRFKSNKSFSFLFSFINWKRKGPPHIKEDEDEDEARSRPTRTYANTEKYLFRWSSKASSSAHSVEMGSKKTRSGCFVFFFSFLYFLSLFF